MTPKIISFHSNFARFPLKLFFAAGGKSSSDLKGNDNKCWKQGYSERISTESTREFQRNRGRRGKRCLAWIRRQPLMMSVRIGGMFFP